MEKNEEEEEEEDKINEEAEEEEEEEEEEERKQQEATKRKLIRMEEGVLLIFPLPSSLSSIPPSPSILNSEGRGGEKEEERRMGDRKTE